MSERPHERFARAVDGLPHEVLDGSEREELATDLAIVHELRKLGAAAVPDQAARDRMRTKVLQSLPEQPAEPARHARASRKAASGRVLVAAAAVACLLLTLSGMSLLLARDALPGDSLYQFKQLSERASLSMTFDQQARARKHLEFATTRLSELQAMIDAQSSEIENYQLALRSLDNNATEGARQLIALSSGKNHAPLAELRTWVDSERTHLRMLRLPAEVAPRASDTGKLLDRIADRVTQLEGRLHCQRLTSGLTDTLGPLPATGRCVPPQTPGAAAKQPGSQPPHRPGHQPGTATGPGAPPADRGPVGSVPPGSPNPPSQRPPSRDEPPLLPPLLPKPPPLLPKPSEPIKPPIDLPPLLPGLPGILDR